MKMAIQEKNDFSCEIHVIILPQRRNHIIIVFSLKEFFSEKILLSISEAPAKNQ
ncbi:MAG: hypothetical protein ABF802_08375 [Acetobacter orientalis]|uniref:hypothetical protein n=1 Tax=Acetobacter orientalis TaxID=146474 RepID=UPI0039EB56A1